VRCCFDFHHAIVDAMQNLQLCVSSVERRQAAVAVAAAIVIAIEQGERHLRLQFRLVVPIVVEIIPRTEDGVMQERRWSFSCRD